MAGIAARRWRVAAGLCSTFPGRPRWKSVRASWDWEWMARIESGEGDNPGSLDDLRTIGIRASRIDWLGLVGSSDARRACRIRSCSKVTWTVDPLSNGPRCSPVHNTPDPIFAARSNLDGSSYPIPLRPANLSKEPPKYLDINPWSAVQNSES
jgi:hypothetical protein